MRDRNVLKGIDQVAILWKYLYMDKSHAIEVENAVGNRLQITMNECDRVLEKEQDEAGEAVRHEETYSLREWMEMIEQLKKQPIKDMADWGVENKVKTRWEEIKLQVAVRTAIHDMQSCG